MARIAEATELTQWGGEKCLPGEMDPVEESRAAEWYADCDAERRLEEQAGRPEEAWGPVTDMEEVTF